MIANAPVTTIVLSPAMSTLAELKFRGAMAAIESPCNKVCVVDAASGLCVGCGRTLAEIGSWIGLTPDQRRQIMTELPARLAALPQPPGNNLT